MILFKIFHIKKILKEARQNPSRLAGDEVKDALWGIVMIPLVIGILGVTLFFILGYTHLLGFQWGFFKFLFWLSLIVSYIIFSIVRRIVRTVSGQASIRTKSVLKTLNLDQDTKSN